MEVKDILSIIFSLLALGFSLYSIFKDRKKDQNDVTFKMLDRWTSDPLRTYRTHGMQLLKNCQKHKDEEKGIPIYIGVIRDKFPNDYKSLSEVFHFFSDLNKLLENKMLNKKLTKELFKSTIESWFERIGKVEYRSYETSKTDNKRMREFFEDEILPLANQLEFKLKRINTNEDSKIRTEKMKDFEKYYLSQKEKKPAANKG